MSFSLNQLLIFAARASNYALAEERIALGADPNYSDPSHGSAAMESVSRGDIDMLNIFLKHGLDPTGAAAIGHGGLIEAAFHHRQEAIAVLLAERGFRLLPHSRSIYREQLEDAFSKPKKIKRPTSVNGSGGSPSP